MQPLLYAGSAQIAFSVRGHVRCFRALFAVLEQEADDQHEQEQRAPRRHQIVPREAGPGVFILQRVLLDLRQRWRRVLARGDGARGDQLVIGCGAVLGVEGQDAKEVISRLEGIQCGFKPTSCPDQLAQALNQALNEA